MRPRRILLNALTTVTQTLGSAAALFLLYRFLIRSVGLERLGIWSLVLATTSFVWLANQGFSTSLIKFVAKYAARQKSEDVSLLIQTALISIGVALAALSSGLYPLAHWILRILLPARRLPEATAILPLAIISLWLTLLESVLQAALAGHELIAECNYLEISGSLSYLFLAFALVPRHGLVGLAWAQVLQIAAIVAITWFLLRKRVRVLPFFPHRWSRAHFRELATYGLHFQMITASQALREPLTKALITKFGGLAFTGLYDLAARCVMTVRELLVQANQVLIPTVAHLHERDPQSIPGVYRESYRLLFFLGIPAFACLAVASPVLSGLWIGHYEAAFVEFVAILCVAWLVNVLANPSYVVFLGTGALRWVSTGCIATIALSASLGYVAGSRAAAAGFGGLAVVVTSGLSLVAGYIVVIAAFHRQNHIPLRNLLPDGSHRILAASFASAFILLPALCAVRTHLPAASRGLTAAGAALLLITILIPVWLHPMRKRVLRWVFSRVPA